MEATSQDNKIGLAKAIGIGVIGSLLGTIAMDLVQVVQFLIMGEPVLTYLNLIGSVLGGGIRLGTVVHILIGAALGVVFIVPVLTIGILHIDTFRKGVVVGTVIGVVSIVACVPFSLLSGIAMLQLLSFMAIPHMVWGVVTGMVVGYRLPSATPARGL